MDHRLRERVFLFVLSCFGGYTLFAFDCLRYYAIICETLMIMCLIISYTYACLMILSYLSLYDHSLCLVMSACIQSLLF